MKSHLSQALKFMLPYFPGAIRTTTFSLLMHEANNIGNNFQSMHWPALNHTFIIKHGRLAYLEKKDQRQRNHLLCQCKVLLVTHGS